MVLKLDGRGKLRAAREMAGNWDHDAMMRNQAEFAGWYWHINGRPPEWDVTISRLDRGW